MKNNSKIILLYKPYGVLSSFTDSDGQRLTLKDFVPVEGVYSAGRLDLDSEGLLLLTDDGDLIHQLTAPDHKIPKTYLVQVEGIATPEGLALLEQGVLVKGRMTRRCQAMVVPEPNLPDREKPVTPHGPTTWLRIVLREGKKRQIRHMTASVGLPTLRIVRIAIGHLNLEGLNPGEWRELEPREVARLQESLSDANRIHRRPD